jgi:hypothetical protein
MSLKTPMATGHQLQVTHRATGHQFPVLIENNRVQLQITERSRSMPNEALTEIKEMLASRELEMAMTRYELPSWRGDEIQQVAFATGMTLAKAAKFVAMHRTAR